MSKINVLIFPAEGENAYELHSALSYCVNINLYGASSVARHGQYLFSNYSHNLPFITAPSFIEEFNDYLQANKIDCVFPTHDTIALFLQEHASDIHAKLIMGDLYTAKICRSKIQTYELLADCNFVPRRYRSVDANINFPLFSKPDEGEGAHGAKMVNNIEELQLIDFNNNLVTEYLPGKEYTVDCLTDKDGQLRYVSPRTRERIMAGISVSGQNIRITDEIQYIAETINQRLHFLGLWYFQLRQDKDGKMKLMEISTRCSGTMCLTRAKGINLPLLSVYTAMGYDIKVADNGNLAQMDRALIGRYNLNISYDDVFIDFDDTITIRGHINPMAIAFLYQCKNQNKRVHLLTRHEDDIHKDLAKYAISESLFDFVDCVIKESKSSVIEKYSTNKAIFIDNAYQERIDVATNCNIPTFDADAFEFLLDWRI